MDREAFLALYGLAQETAARLERMEIELREFRSEARDWFDCLERVWNHRDHVLMEHDRHLFELENKE